MVKKSRPRTRRLVSMRGPFVSAHPLNDVPFEVRQRVVSDHGRRQREQFESILPKIIALVSRLDPLNTLALMTTYGLTGTPDQRRSHKRSTWTPKVQQGHVEFLQALCLRNQLKSGAEFPEPPSIQLLFDELPELFDAYQTMRLGPKISPAELTSPDHEATIMHVQEFIRAHTSVVRNWGYFGNVTRLSRDLLSKIDSDYERLAGMKLSRIVDVFEGLVRRQESWINYHFEKVHGALSLPTKEAMLEKFFSTFELKGDVDSLREALASSEVSYMQAKYALLPWADRFLGEGFILTNQEIADDTGLPLEAISLLTNRLSFGFGDLADQDAEHFFLDNPVWFRPLIYIQKNYYFCALPQTLLSFIYPIAEELLAPFDGLGQKLSNAKAVFLEDEVARLFDLALPGSIGHRGFKWREGAQQFESDLVIRFDTTLILVETKSGRISWPALRGAPSRLIEHIKKLIVEPSDQSGRLAQRLEEDIARLKGNEAPTLGFPIPLDGITCVVRLSVMLHDFATIQSVPAMLADAGILKNKFPLAPCMALPDLEVMLDLLETPYLRLHYLRRRAKLLMSMRAIGDELDMLGMYLDTALNLSPNLTEKKVLINSGYSMKIDRYYSRRDESLPGKKPQPNTSQWFKRLCAQLEERGRRGWSEAACALLSVASSDQTKFEQSIRRIASKMKARKLIKNGQDTVILIPPESDEQALAFQVTRPDTQVPYSSASQGIAQQAFESKHVKRCVVIVVNATDTNLSYLSVAMFIEGETRQAIFF